ASVPVVGRATSVYFQKERGRAETRGERRRGRGRVPAMNERLLTPISTVELERRWVAVRKEMGERGIDALLMQNNNDWLGGYVKWFTDLPAVNGYPRTVIFYADDPMSVIEMGSHGGRRDLKGGDKVHRGVG